MPIAEDPDDEYRPPRNVAEWMRRYVLGHDPDPVDDDPPDRGLQVLTPEQWHRVVYERWRYEKGELNERGDD